MEKARKAYFKIKKTIGLNNACKLLEKLFDSLVSPILLYGCEVWGIDFKFKDSDSFEKLHIKFIKEILGVHCRASNDACRAELNRVPLKNKIIFSSINFLQHIISSEHSLINNVFKKSQNSSPWFKKIKNILDDLGMSFIANDLNFLKSNLNQIKQRINDQCFQNQQSNINKSEKLDFFRKVYSTGKRAPYVDILQNRNDRAAVCKIRISSHTLMIERGRQISKFPKI